MPATESEINDFLYKFKFFATSGGFSFVSRDKNMISLSELGISPDQVICDIINNLGLEHYSSGPKQDKGCKDHKIWIFGFEYDGMELYIKLSGDLKYNVAKCISLHKAEHKILYPHLRKAEGGE